MGLIPRTLPIHQRKSPAFFTIPVLLAELHRARCTRVGDPMGHVFRSKARSKWGDLVLALLALKMYTRVGCCGTDASETSAHQRALLGKQAEVVR